MANQTNLTTVYLSIGTGEDETDTIEICNSNSLSNRSIAKKIAEELKGIDLSTLYLQLCVEHKDKIAWSLYTTNTGVFEHWDGDQITESDETGKGIMDTMREVTDLLYDHIRILDSPHGLSAVDYCLLTNRKFKSFGGLAVITPKGEKPIFGFDDENLYTACGISVSIENARMRVPFP